ncbi:hypothetical protein RB593_006920 [Gaeumannomyces tritici]
MAKTTPLMTSWKEHEKPGSPPPPRHWARRALLPMALLGAIAVFAPGLLPWGRPPTALPSSPSGAASPAFRAPKCAQVEPLLPNATSPRLRDMDALFSTPAFRDLSAARLSGAVRIPTVSHDDMGAVGEDPRWLALVPLRDYLAATFPLAHAALRRELVNEHGLLYTWAGSDASLGPTVLMAHQDVVPVADETLDQWTHPPFSGLYDGARVWGRGASDCKNNLVGILAAVEALAAAGFRPRRTLVLSFGFDEEISGARGAGHLSRALLSRYGPDSAAVVVDEGAAILNQWGATFAAPGVAEKGAVDVEVVVRMPGGHSSIPPRHNAIGVAAQVVAAAEGDPYPPRLHAGNPFLDVLRCGDEHAPAFPDGLRRLLRERDHDGSGGGGGGGGGGSNKDDEKDELAEEAARAGDMVRYLFATSATPTIARGGIKSNALPERVVLTVNHRINVGESFADVRAKLAQAAGAVAARHNLTLHAFEKVPSFDGEDDDDDEPPSSVTLRVRGAPLEPAPVTPTSTEGGTTPYGVLAGTTRGVYGERLLVAPALMTGNTDTRYYWDLTRHIFRYGPQWEDGAASDFDNGIHTVNERVSIAAHVNGIKWYSSFIRNMDEAVLE